MGSLKNYSIVSDSRTFELPSKDFLEYKGMRYIVRHKYQDSGEELIDVLKKQLLKTLESLDNAGVLCYNEDVNIFG